MPLINLAITTSGVSLSTNLPATVSPSRLLQASTFLTAADSQYAASPGVPVQVGPAYTLSLYMLFAGHAWRPQDHEDIRETTWKEVIHKARVKLMRVSLNRLYELPDQVLAGSTTDIPRGHSIPGQGAALEYAYRLVLVEDLDDDRVHSFDQDEPQPAPFDDVVTAGIRDLVPIHEISKIFYADTGKILNIGSEGETNNPVLLLKRDIHAEPPRRMMERHTAEDFEDAGDDVEREREGSATSSSSHSVEQAELDAQIRRESFPTLPTESEAEIEPSLHPHWRLPPDLDPEWIALEVYNEEADSEDEAEMETSEFERSPSYQPSERQRSLDPTLTGAMSGLNLQNECASPSSVRSPVPEQSQATTLTPVSVGPVKTSLSLLEMLIRLTALQQFRQASHLTIEDELLNFFLEDSSTTGAGTNADYRQRVRRDARRRVGFDPYDESPIKRRGEEYLAHPRASPRLEQDWEHESYHEGYDNQWSEHGTPPYVRPSIEYPPFPKRNDLPSSPSPIRRPGSISAKSSPGLSTPARLRYAQSLATPPGSLKSRQAMLRSQSEKPSSPLARYGDSKKHDSTPGTSPSSEDLKSRAD